MKKVLPIFLVLIIGFYFYNWFFIPPFRLPKGARNLEFAKALPLSWALDSQVKFNVNEDELITWIEAVSGFSFKSIKIRYSPVQHTRYSVINMKNRVRILTEAKLVPELKQWMDLEQVNEGFAIFNLKPYGGNLIFDKDREIAYYNFWD